MMIATNISYLNIDFLSFNHKFKEFIIRNASRLHLLINIDVLDDNFRSHFNIEYLLSGIREINFREFENQSVETVVCNGQKIFEVFIGTVSFSLVDVCVWQDPLCTSTFIGSYSTVVPVILREK